MLPTLVLCASALLFATVSGTVVKPNRATWLPLQGKYTLNTPDTYNYEYPTQYNNHTATYVGERTYETDVNVFLDDVDTEFRVRIRDFNTWTTKFVLDDDSSTVVYEVNRTYDIQVDAFVDCRADKEALYIEVVEIYTNEIQTNLTTTEAYCIEWDLRDGAAEIGCRTLDLLLTREPPGGSWFEKPFPPTGEAAYSWRMSLPGVGGVDMYYANVAAATPLGASLTFPQGIVDYIYTSTYDDESDVIGTQMERRYDDSLRRVWDSLLMSATKRRHEVVRRNIVADVPAEHVESCLAQIDAQTEDAARRRAYYTTEEHDVVFFIWDDVELDVPSPSTIPSSCIPMGQHNPKLGSPIASPFKAKALSVSDFVNFTDFADDALVAFSDASSGAIDEILSRINMTALLLTLPANELAALGDMVMSNIDLSSMNLEPWIAALQSSDAFHEMRKDTEKLKAATVGALLLSIIGLVCGVVAIFTSIRLRQLAEQKEAEMG